MRIIPMVKPEASASAHLSGLDALRALAAIGVVVLHAGVPYLRHPMPGLLWPVREPASDLVDTVFWSIEIFIMPVFLMMAGFFAFRSANAAGGMAMLRSRAKRLLVPLSFGVLIVLPIDLYVWTLGLVAEGAVPAVKLRSLKFDPPIGDQIWGLAHLWFLAYLFLYVAVAAAAWRIPIPERFTHLLRRNEVFALLAIATVSLAAAPEVVWGFQHAYLPVLSKWIYSGAFFWGGWCLARRDPGLQVLQQHRYRLAATSLILLIAGVSMGRWYLNESLATGTVSWWQRLTLGLITVAAASSTSLGLMVWFARLFRHGVSRPISYVAAASFWIYLVHHPLVALVHIDLRWRLSEYSSVSKFFIASVSTMTLTLVTYEFLVRRTTLGLRLGFRSATERTASLGEATPAELRAAAPEVPATIERRNAA